MADKRTILAKGKKKEDPRKHDGHCTCFKSSASLAASAAAKALILTPPFFLSSSEPPFSLRLINGINDFKVPIRFRGGGFAFAASWSILLGLREDITVVNASPFGLWRDTLSTSSLRLGLLIAPSPLLNPVSCTNSKRTRACENWSYPISWLEVLTI